MRWNIDTQRNSTQFSSELQSEQWDDLTLVLTELWCKAITESAAFHSPLDWNALFFNLWLDSGQLIAYPGIRGRNWRTERVSISLYIRAIELMWRNIPSPNCAAEAAEYESQCDKLANRVWSALSHAASLKPAVDVIAAHHTSHDFVAIVFQYNDDIDAFELPLRG